ncbi:MAG: helix-turn-helix domain-containing protein [Elusimicrobiota bacterium]|jgi:transcriptional regulator with XRE-family HTH domain|nr:helix-turn-helix domain-containing protein [Elusimicrobiota bacterium]
MDNKILGNRIKESIKEMGITQEEFAKSIGTSRTMISKWIRGDRNMSLTSLKKVAQASGKPIQFFFEIDKTDKDNGGDKKDNIQNDIFEIELIKKEIELLKTKYDTKIENIETLIDNLNLRIDLIGKG